HERAQFVRAEARPLQHVEAGGPQRREAALADIIGDKYSGLIHERRDYNCFQTRAHGAPSTVQNSLTLRSRAVLNCAHTYESCADSLWTFLFIAPAASELKKASRSSS